MSTSIIDILIVIKAFLVIDTSNASMGQLKRVKNHKLLMKFNIASDHLYALHE